MVLMVVLVVIPVMVLGTVHWAIPMGGNPGGAQRDANSGI